ncbi:hypothetical protein Barb7_01804 [Bacteroidales bacterium Barb7]|nr:hypothetical protein Barb7_01804 [Bacteroidales bacterium Barb7]
MATLRKEGQWEKARLPSVVRPSMKVTDRRFAHSMKVPGSHFSIDFGMVTDANLLHRKKV